ATDRANALAISALSGAMPFELQTVRPTVERLFGHESNKTTRWALAGAMALFGDRSAAVMDLLEEAENMSELPVRSQILAWADERQRLVEDDRFMSAASSVHDHFVDADNSLDVIHRVP